MDIDYCSYHYQNPATWSCPGCERFFGDCCISRNQADVKRPRCYLCSRELAGLGASNTVEPFWNSVHRFLIYPMKAGPLLLIIGLAALSTLLSMSLIGAAMVLFIMVVATRYAFAIIEHSSQGRTTPPSLTILFTIDEDRLFLRQMVVFIFAGAAVTAAGMFNNTFINLAVIGFMTLALPASVLVLAIEKRVMAAVNPVLLTQLMLNMGTGYLVLYAFVNILSGGPGVILEYFIDSIPQSWFIPFFVAVNLYFWFVTAHLMGYSLLQYQKQLGFRADLERESVELEPADRTAAADIKRETNVLIIEGRYDDAYSILKKAITTIPNDVQLQMQFNVLLAAMQKRKELTNHSDDLIGDFLHRNSAGKAADVFINTIKAVPDYKPAAAEDLDRLSEHFYMVGQHKTALVLIAHLTRDHSGYAELDNVILRAARIHAEGLNQPDKALQIAKHLINKPGVADTIKQQAQKLETILSS